MKVGPVTKLDKKNTASQKNLTMTLCQQIVTSWLFFQFMTNLEQSGSRISDVSSVKLIFLVIVNFYFAKIANRTRKYLTQLSYYFFEQRYLF